MTEAERLADLRELFLHAPESGAAQAVALVFGLSLAAGVLWLVRRRTLRAEYTPIWMAVALATLVVGVDLDVLRWLSRLLGAWTISATLFMLGQLFLVAICLNYAVRISQSAVHIRDLAQEVALLRQRLERLEPAPSQTRPPAAGEAR
ncbi:MAG: DUF2304 domain-containing protein [Deltaproteobacteria bacterium]|nr:DUF2304 domain-containing protein [Deltaproteobacteria bacterium]